MAETSESKGNTPAQGLEEDVDLEFYELRDEALKRWAIKSSVKIHFVVWAVINTFLVFLNLFVVNLQVTGLGDFWVFWTLCGWGFGLYVHATAWFTVNVKDLPKKVFLIHVLIGIGLISFLAAVNLLTTPTYQWFWWVLVGEFAIIILHYYITFISTSKQVEQAILREMNHLRQQKKRTE